MNRYESRRSSRSDRKRRSESIGDDVFRRSSSSGGKKGRRGSGSKVVVAKQHTLPVAWILKGLGALAAVLAPVLLLLGPQTGLVAVGNASTTFFLLILIAVTAIGLGAVVDAITTTIVEIRELNAHLNRQWKLRRQGQDEAQNDSTPDATASS